MSQELIDQLIEAGHRLDARGWVPGGGGNFSARLSPGRYLLTASGRHKGRLRAQDFLVVDHAGKPEDPRRTPSAETLLHCERLNALTDIGCVLHGHSPAATVLSRRVQAAVVTLEGFEMLKGLGGGITRHDTRVDIPLFDNDQDIVRLADVIARHHARQPIHHGYLIRGHGVYAWGRDVDDAINHYEALEFLLACALRELPTP